MAGPKGNIVGERIDSLPTTIEDGQTGPALITPNRALHVNLRDNSGGAVNLGAGLVPETHDYIELSYTGANLTGVVYKTGGSGGTTVATLTLAYTGAVLDSVTRT